MRITKNDIKKTIATIIFGALLAIGIHSFLTNYEEQTQLTECELHDPTCEFHDKW